MAVTPYLHFPGTCEEALEHYAKALGATATIMMRYGDAPPEFQGDADKAKWVMHANLMDGEVPLLMASDAMHDTSTKPSGVSLSLSYPDVDKAKAIFAALAEGGETTMPISPAFWGGEFGVLDDRFGMTWMISAGGAG